MKFQPKMLFTLAVLAMSGYAVITSSAWPLTMSLFPWIVGIPVFVLGVWQLITEMKQAASSDGPSKEDTGDLQVDLDMGAKVVAAKAGNFFGWLLGFFAVTWIFGFFLSVPLYTFFYLKLEAKESWLTTIVLTLCTFIFFAGLFDQILHLSWHTPLIEAPEEFVRSIIPDVFYFED